MADDLILKDNPTLGDLQDYVRKMKELRNLNLTDPKLDCKKAAN